MDDLDHSMHIAEYDWTSFYEESEECSLLQPSLACLDNLSLSDSENSEILSSAFSTVQQDTQQIPDVNSDAAKNSDAGCRTDDESCIQLLLHLNTNATGGEQVEVTAGAEEGSVTQVDCEMCRVCTAGNTEQHVKTAEDTEKTTDNVKNTFQPELSVQCPEVSKELNKEDGKIEIETGHSKHEPDSVFLQQTHLNVNEPPTTQEAGSDSVSSAIPRAEKERWFVTINDRPARQRVPASAVKKKQRQKRLCRNKRSSWQEPLEENTFKMNRSENECEGGMDTRGFTQSNPSLVQNIGRAPSAGKKTECTSDTSQKPCEDDQMSKNIVISHFQKKHIIDRNRHVLASAASRSDETFTTKDPSQLESTKSHELEDGVELFSVHSYHSENYISAAESVDESPHSLTDHLIENQQFPLTTRNLLDIGDIQDREIHSCDSDLSRNTSATNCRGCELTTVESILAFPSANKMPDDNSTCDNDTRSTGLCTASCALTPLKQEIHLLASGGSSGHKFSLLPVPDLTVTPCSVASSPETYARAAGHSKPVYAISAFWDDMEKRTINDILLLRMTSATTTQDTVTTNVEYSSTNNSFLVGTMDNNLNVGGLTDTSDTADSDYFTQPDECKPDCSSREFSTSDFDEEYWQFIGASRNTSPDPQGKTQQQESPSTCSEEKRTPVPLADLAEWCVEDHESHTQSEVSWPWQINGETAHKVPILDTEDIHLQSLLDTDEGNLSLSSCQSLYENQILKVKDTMDTQILAPVLSSTDILDDRYQISFPEVFEYLFTDDKGNNSKFVSIYDPEDVSVDSVFDCTLCSVRDGISFSSLHDSQHSENKPIPIFSSSHPTVRELTFPKVDDVPLNAPCEENYMSPIRITSCAFMQASDCGAGRTMGLLSMRKICFHDKGSIWCQSSGAWMFPFESEKTKINWKDTPNAVLAKGRVYSAPTQLFRQPTPQQTIWKTIRTRRDGIFSALRQSDMCLVCIAFASWVLRSSDPEAADTWKAALLANVSALSAIQFLREYVKKNHPLDIP